MRSLHTHNVLMGSEDLPDLAEALAAEPDRRLGRRLPWTCFVPAGLQYSSLGKYTTHVRRYLEVFGSDRVKCILFDDLKNDAEKTYRETLAFLGIEPLAGSPDFKVFNDQQGWRFQRLGWATIATSSLVYTLCSHLPTRILRRLAHALLGVFFFLSIKPNLTKARRRPISAEVQETLRHAFREDVEQLAGRSAGTCRHGSCLRRSVRAAERGPMRGRS